MLPDHAPARPLDSKEEALEAVSYRGGPHVNDMRVHAHAHVSHGETAPFALSWRAHTDIRNGHQKRLLDTPFPLRGVREVPTAPKWGPTAPCASGANRLLETTTMGILPLWVGCVRGRRCARVRVDATSFMGKIAIPVVSNSRFAPEALGAVGPHLGAVGTSRTPRRGVCVSRRRF